MAAVPYILSGIVVDDDNVTARANIPLTATNARTGERISMSTDANGEFAFDCADFPSGYDDLDYIRILTNTTGTNGQDLRIRVIARGIGQINEIKAEYTTR